MGGGERTHRKNIEKIAPAPNQLARVYLMTRLRTAENHAGGQQRDEEQHQLRHAAAAQKAAGRLADAAVAEELRGGTRTGHRQGDSLDHETRTVTSVNTGLHGTQSAAYPSMMDTSQAGPNRDPFGYVPRPKSLKEPVATADLQPARQRPTYNASPL